MLTFVSTRSFAAVACSAPSGQAGAARATETSNPMMIMHDGNDVNGVDGVNGDHGVTGFNGVECTNETGVEYTNETITFVDSNVESVIEKHGIKAASRHDETSRVDEISTASAAGQSDHTSKNGSVKPSDVHETGEVAVTALSDVALSASLLLALPVHEGGANNIPKPEGGDGGSADEVLLLKENIVPRDSAKVLTRAEARKKYGKFLGRKYDFETIPHDETR